jgi:hypothetical protein
MAMSKVSAAPEWILVPRALVSIPVSQPPLQLMSVAIEGGALAGVSF